MQPLRYVALIGDVVASRERPDRAELQEALLDWADELSADLGVLAAPLTLTAGDSVQALLHEEGAGEVVRWIQELTDRLVSFPAPATFPPIRFGVGYGTLSTGDIAVGAPPAANPALLDGACFQEAREALEQAGRKKHWCRFRGFGPPRTLALDALFDLMGALRSRWTATQAQHVALARELETQREVAERLAVNPSVISESLKAAHFEPLLAGEAAARALLEDSGARR